LSRGQPKQSATAGFTLLEVVVAIAVTAAVLASIGSLAFANMRNVRAIEQDLSAVEVSRVILGHLPDRQTLAPGSYTGAIAGNRWRIDVTPYVGEYAAQASIAGRQPAFSPMLVIVTVQGPGGRLQRLETIRLARRGRE
jgi:general secretion pathway protein I